MQLIEFVRVAGATEVEVLIPTGGGMFANRRGYSRNAQRCSSNETFDIGTPRIALQKVVRIGFSVLLASDRWRARGRRSDHQS
jgi:hypothetical protein